MINLDNYINRTIDFKIGGKIVKVKEPSFLDIESFSNSLVKEQGDNIELILELLVKLLNNNTSKTVFTIEQLKGYPKAVINKIIEEIARDRDEIEADPN